jgi:flagellar assembly protein FliH
MSTVIKSGATNVQRIAFNLHDISQEADRYLDQVRVKAAQIVVEAQKQAEAVRRQAEAEGKEAAMRAAERVLEEKVGKRMESLLPALDQVVQKLTDARQSWLRHWEKSTVHLACAIAEKITRHTLGDQPDVTVDLVREALEMAAGSPVLEIRMNPADVESLGSHVGRLAAQFGGLASLKVTSDPSITLGACRIDMQHGSIDQQFEAQLKRIEAELTSGNED